MTSRLTQQQLTMDWPHHCWLGADSSAGGAQLLLVQPPLGRICRLHCPLVTREQ